MSAACIWCAEPHLDVDCSVRSDVNWIGSARHIYVHAYLRGRDRGRTTERTRIAAGLRRRAEESIPTEDFGQVEQDRMEGARDALLEAAAWVEGGDG